MDVLKREEPSKAIYIELMHRDDAPQFANIKALWHKHTLTPNHRDNVTMASGQMNDKYSQEIAILRMQSVLNGHGDEDQSYRRSKLPDHTVKEAP